jgi:putative transposase
MARIARVVVPGLPRHVTQRGNRREPVFFEADHYRLYRRLVAAAARRAGTAVWAYCLMPNHVHLIGDAGGRGRVAGDLCRSAPALHRGHQRSVPLDGPSVPGSLWGGGDGRAAFIGGARYIALNPVVAGLVSRGEDWPWSSTRAQLAGEEDECATVVPLRALIPDFAALLAMPTDAATTTRIERAPTIGRPLALRKPGPKRRVEPDTARQAHLL